MLFEYCYIVHLLSIQEQTEKEEVTEQLKEQDQMLWVKRMNNIRAMEQETVREKEYFVYNFKEEHGVGHALLLKVLLLGGLV